MKNYKMSWLALAILCLSFVFGASIFSVQAQQEGFSEAFDNPDLPGWDRTPGVEVSEGLLFIEPDNFVYRPGEWGDFEITILVRQMTPGNFMVSFRAAGAQGYHLVVEENLLAFQKEINGKVDDLNNAASPEIPIGEWFPLSINIKGGDLAVSIHGEEPILKASDPAPLSGGGVSIETFSGTYLEVNEITLLASNGEDAGIDENQDSSQAAPVVEAGELPQLPWIYTGGPNGGLGYDIRMDPRNSQVMYVTDALAGAFKSLDGGENWFQINDGITARTGTSVDGIPVFSLSIDPNNPDTLWVGTQFGGGVFRSDDGGKSWISKANGIQEPSLTIRGFTVEPGNSNSVYLAGEVSSWDWNNEVLNGVQFDLTRGVVYKTSDRGENWSRIWEGENLARYVIIDPDDHQKIYVSTGIFDREAANSDPETLEPGGVGVLRSSDGGLTWEELGTENGFRYDELYVGSLMMHPENPNVLFAATGSDAHLFALGRDIGAIYRTVNGGDSWERVLDLPNASAVEICLSDPNVVYGGATSFIARSDDGGDTWQIVNGTEGRLDLFWGPDDLVAGFPIDMQCDPDDPMKIYVNNYGGGNFLSTDGGLTWKNASTGYTGAIMSTVVSVPENPALVYSTARSGIFRSRDGGLTWEGMSRGVARAMEGKALAVDPFDYSHLVTTLEDGGPIPKISDDGGETWHDSSGQRNSGEEFAWKNMYKVEFSPIEAGRMIGVEGTSECGLGTTCTDGMGVVYSIDGAESWQASNLEGRVATELAFSPAGVAYAVLYPADLYQSEDGGENWELVSADLTPGVSNPDPDIYRLIMMALEVDPEDHSRLYAGFTFGGVSISEDGGLSWKNSSAGMIPEAEIFDLVADPAHFGVIYAASRNSGVYRSLDYGATWEVLNEGLTNRAVVSLSLSADGRILYAATDGAGVFRLSPDGQAPENVAVPPSSTETTVEPVAESPSGETEEQQEEIIESPDDDNQISDEGGSDLQKLIWLVPIILIGGGAYYLVFKRKG